MGIISTLIAKLVTASRLGNPEAYSVAVAEDVTGAPAAFKVDRRNNLHINGSIRYWLPYVPAAGDIPLGPCDAVLVDTDGVILTAKAADSSAASVVGPPIAKNVWHPMSCIQITAKSAGNVWIGWYRKPVA